jgi:hypothetical protein
MLAGKEEAMNYLMQRLLKRNPAGKKPMIALLDGDPNLKRALEKALHGERSDARIAWVREKLLAILEGKVRRVIGGFKQMVTKETTTSPQQRVLKKAITYFENHRDMMDYKTYLEKGYPIATGLVEGACNSLVKDRMEQSGMRWTVKGATSILKQRAVKLNGDWNTFWEHYMQSQKADLYPLYIK